MKTKLSIISFLLIITAFVYSYSNSEKEGLDNLLLKNIEALAGGEYDDTTNCYDRGSVDCPYEDVKVKYVMEGYSLESFY